MRGVYGSDEMISGVWLLIEMFRSHVMTQFLNSNPDMKLRRKLTSFRSSSELEVPFNHEVVYFFNFQLFLSSGIFDFMCIFISNVSHWSRGRPPGRHRCDLVVFSEAELLIFNISLSLCLHRGTMRLLQLLHSAVRSVLGCGRSLPASWMRDYLPGEWDYRLDCAALMWHFSWLSQTAPARRGRVRVPLQSDHKTTVVQVSSSFKEEGCQTPILPVSLLLIWLQYVLSCSIFFFK